MAFLFKKLEHTKYKSMFFIVIGGYLLLVITVYFLQRSLQYFPSGTAMLPANFQEKKIITQDNVELLVWQNIPKDYKKIIVYFHGNAGNIGDRSYRFETFINKGYGVIALSYRGYFGSQEKPSESGFILDAQAVLKFIGEQNIAKKDLILFGESIGSGVVCQIAQNKILLNDDIANLSKNSKENSLTNPTKETLEKTLENSSQKSLENISENIDDFFMIILESPFYSILEIAQKTYPFLPVKFMLKDRFDSFLYSPNITSKVLIFHGDQDKIVALESGKKLFNTITSKKKFIEMRGASHVDTNPEFIIQQIEEFN